MKEYVQDVIFSWCFSVMCTLKSNNVWLLYGLWSQLLQCTVDILTFWQLCEKWMTRCKEKVLPWQAQGHVPKTCQQHHLQFRYFLSTPLYSLNRPQSSWNRQFELSQMLKKQISRHGKHPLYVTGFPLPTSGLAFAPILVPDDFLQIHFYS